ncbi:MAG: translation initiation factor IF-3 [Alphaproteobacteria bacterium]|nr:translation initiation factor IF-3 [Alphaproteobacteria bacterium]
MEAFIVTENTHALPTREGPRANQEITAKQVRLIGPEGENFDVVSIKEALAKADEFGLDLIEIAPNSTPPVCKILDLGKYRYEIQKRKAEAKKNQRVVEIKEIKLSPNIESHDFEVKMKSAQRFIKEGNKVKFTLRFRGREMSYMDQGEDIMGQVVEDSALYAKVDQPPKLEGKQITLIISPK